jgi:N-acetylglucosamine transport system substrate-binding protein
MAPFADHASFDVLPVIETPPFDLDIALRFHMAGSAATDGTGDAFFIPSRASLIIVADEAIDFLKFLSSLEEMSEMVSSRGLPSTIKGTDEAIKSDTLKTALNVIDEAEGLTYIPTAINDSYPEFTINITNQIQALLLGEVSPEEFTDYAEEQAETLRNDDSIEKVEYKFGEK